MDFHSSNGYIQFFIKHLHLYLSIYQHWEWNYHLITWKWWTHYAHSYFLSIAINKPALHFTCSVFYKVDFLLITNDIEILLWYFFLSLKSLTRSFLFVTAMYSLISYFSLFYVSCILISLRSQINWCLNCTSDTWTKCFSNTCNSHISLMPCLNLYFIS